MVVKLKAPVGDKTREEGDKVRNLQKDVDLVRMMLRSAGFMVAPEGKFDPGVLKAIKAAQKKAGIKYPDGVIDPGQRTFKWLLPKYLKADKAADKVEVVEIPMEGGAVTIRKTEYEPLVKQLAKAIADQLKAMQQAHERGMKQLVDWEDMQRLRDGFIDALQKVFTGKPPIVKPFNRALGEALRKLYAAAVRCADSMDLAGAIKIAIEIEQKVVAHAQEVARFVKELTGMGTVIPKIVLVTKEMQKLVNGISRAVFKAGLSVAELAIMEAARGLQVARKVFNAVTGGVVSKVADFVITLSKTIFDKVMNLVDHFTAGASFIANIAKALAKGVMSFMPKLPIGKAIDMLKRYLIGPAKDKIGSIYAEVMKKIKPVMGGKPPTVKDIETMFHKLVDSFLSGDLYKRLGSVMGQVLARFEKLLSGSILPDILKTIAKIVSIPASTIRNIATKLIRMVATEVLEFFQLAVGGLLKGIETVEKILQMGMKALENSSQLIKSIEKHAVKEAKALLPV